MSKELFDKLTKLRAKSGKSQSQLLREGLGLVESKVDSAYQKGFREGYGRFDAPCRYCGKPIKFNLRTHAEARDALIAAFSQWHHGDCKG